jgi:CelD/BcsL family acetyltransferase involved in cellulose biosynthesis
MKLGAQASTQRGTAPPIRSAEPLHAEVATDLTAVRDAWSALAMRGDNVFATWEWADVWWRHFGGSRPLRVVVCRDAAGDVRAVVPLYLASLGPLRLLRFVGHGPSDELGPVCAAGDRHLAAAFLQLAVSAVKDRWDLFLGERMRASGDSGALAGARRVRREASPVLRLDGRTWDEWLGTRSANARQQMRRRERKLAREHDLRFRRCTTDAELARDLDVLFALHDARWGDEGSGAFSGARRRFHCDWASLALSHGWLRLWTLELDGRPAAVYYGFRFGQSDSYYQAGRDPERSAGSVGFVLLVRTMRDAADAGMREYRLLRGGEAYKDRFADEDAGVDTILVPATMRGRLAGGGALSLQSLRPEVRRVLGRLVRSA